MPATNQDPGRCNCSVATCNVNFNLRGCNSVALVGAVANVWTDSSKTTFIGSATSNGSGTAAVNIGFAPRTVYYEISKSRFVTLTGTATFAACGDGLLLTLSPASGYHCLSGGCADPLADTLHYSDADGRTATLTFAAGTWGPATTTAADFSATIAPCSPTCAGVVGYSYAVRLVAAGGSVEFDAVRAGAAAPASFCPGAVFDPGWTSASAQQVTCPPSLVIHDVTAPPCFPTYGWTITE